jgi:hypothetical protein
VLRNHRVVALLLLTWVRLVILAAAGGVAVGNRVSIPLLFDYVVDARFLVALPVLIGAEGVIWARVIALSQYLVRSGLIAASPGPGRRFDRFGGQSDSGPGGDWRRVRGSFPQGLPATRPHGNSWPVLPDRSAR